MNPLFQLELQQELREDWRSLAHRIEALHRPLAEDAISAVEMTNWLRQYNAALLAMRDLFDRTILCLEDMADVNRYNRFAESEPEDIVLAVPEPVRSKPRRRKAKCEAL